MTANFPPIKNSAKHAWLALLIVRQTSGLRELGQISLIHSDRSSGSSTVSGWPSFPASTDKREKAGC